MRSYLRTVLGLSVAAIALTGCGVRGTSGSPTVPGGSAAPSSAQQSNSQKYAIYADDSEQRALFTYAQDEKLAGYQSASPNYAAVKIILTADYSRKYVFKTVPLDKTRKLVWIQGGIDVPGEIELVDSSSKQPPQEIFSNFQEGIGINSQITDFAPSPDGKYIYVTLADYGSIDQVGAAIVDVGSETVLATLEMPESNLAWISPTTILYDKLNDDGSDAFSVYDVVKGQDTPSNEYLFGTKKNCAFTADMNINPPSFVLHNAVDGTVQPVNLSMLSAMPSLPVQLIGDDGKNVYILVHVVSSSSSSSVILKFPMKASNGQALVTQASPYIDQAFVDGSAVFAQSRAGADRVITIYQTSDGKALGHVAVPDCCSVTDVKWAEPGQSIQLKLQGPLARKKQDFVWDLKKQAWEKDPSSVMLTDEKGVSYVSEVVYSVSRDGTRIPTRLLHRKDLKQDSSNPVEIQSYGGFDLTGYIDPTFDSPTFEFISRGGIYAAPALRGGDEYGEPWHQAAILKDKIKTFEDLDSVAQKLVSLGWTQPRLIASQGASNGGLTVAATALLFPKDFGLAIPVAGVDDLLGKDVMDATVGGWDYEYGSDAQDAADLAAISPLENASRQGAVKFFIVDGADDTRVNPAHSVKLAKALEDLGGSPGNVQLLTIADAGHFSYSYGYQNVIGLETEVAIWTMIYDMAGWKAQP